MALGKLFREKALGLRGPGGRGGGGGQPRNCWGPLQLRSESRGLSREGEGTTRHWVFPTIKATESEQWRGDRAEPRGGP